MIDKKPQDSAVYGLSALAMTRLDQLMIRFLALAEADDLPTPDQLRGFALEAREIEGSLEPHRTKPPADAAMQHASEAVRNFISLYAIYEYETKVGSLRDPGTMEDLLDRISAGMGMWGGNNE